MVLQYLHGHPPMRIIGRFLVLLNVNIPVWQDMAYTVHVHWYRETSKYCQHHIYQPGARSVASWSYSYFANFEFVCVHYLYGLL